MKNHGKLIVIESGSDASGKATQTQLLFEHLTREGYNVKKIEFPDYDSDSSIFVKMYLRGDFGKNPFEVNPYKASTFYAQDRYISYETKWRKFYEEENNIILCDRYVYSNIINQAIKLNEVDREAYCNWLLHLEFDVYEIPKPDVVIFLDMPIEKSIKLMRDRKNKIDNSDIKDIHERDEEYLRKTYYHALEVAEKFKWNRISCVEDGNIRSIEDIHKQVYSVIKSTIL